MARTAHARPSPSLPGEESTTTQTQSFVQVTSTLFLQGPLLHDCRVPCSGKGLARLRFGAWRHTLWSQTTATYGSRWTQQSQPQWTRPPWPLPLQTTTTATDSSLTSRVCCRVHSRRVGGGGGSNSPACCSCGDAPSATQLTAVDMARDGRMTGHGSQSPSKTPKMLLSCKPFHPTDGRTHGTLHQHSVAHRWITCSRLSLLFA
jgi:hypothetical protein